MNKPVVILIYTLFSISAYADEELLGKWEHSSELPLPSFLLDQYDFLEGNRFHYNPHSDKNRVGTWETGYWTLPAEKERPHKTCNLKLRADDVECCFTYRFNFETLLMKPDLVVGDHGRMCNRRVLVRVSDD